MSTETAVPATPQDSRRPARGSGRSGRGSLRRAGWILVILALVTGGVGCYQLFFTDVIAEGQRDEVSRSWLSEQNPVPQQLGTEHRSDVPVLGGPGVLGLLHVPRWGADYTVPISTGAERDILNRGMLWHLPMTSALGEQGNAGLAGHRTSHGKPLREVHRLRDGDALVIEADSAWLVYRVVAREIVRPEQSEVMDPVPPFAGAEPGRYLTLTTCDPIFGITERYIVWAQIDYWTPREEGIPPALPR